MGSFTVDNVKQFAFYAFVISTPILRPGQIVL